MDFCQGGIGVAGEMHTGVCLTLRRSHVGRSALYHELAYLWPIISASEEYAGKRSAAVKKFLHDAMIACRARMLESGKEAP